jgi:hypothetical protein
MLASSDCAKVRHDPHDQISSRFGHQCSIGISGATFIPVERRAYRAGKFCSDFLGGFRQYRDNSHAQRTNLRSQLTYLVVGGHDRSSYCGTSLNLLRRQVKAILLQRSRKDKVTWTELG